MRFPWNRMDVFQVLHYLSNHFWVLLSTARAERYFFFFFLISAVHWRFYLNCSYKKLMKALSCWATKWQEWIPARWNLLKIQLSKHFCINISLSDSVHTHLQYRTRPGGGEFPTDLHRARSKARSWCLKGSRLLMVHTRSCLWSERKLFFQRKRPQALI